MAFLTCEVRGGQQGIQAFDELKNGVRNRVVRKAVTAGSLPHLTYARKAPEFKNQTGLLRRSFGRRIKTYRGSNVTISVVGPRSGFAKQVMSQGAWNPSTGNRGIKFRKVDPRRYAHLVERGHGGRSPAPPKNPLRNAFVTSRSQCESLFATKFTAEVMIEAGKAAAKARSLNG